MEFMKALYERQSTRNFQKMTLSQGQIEIILKAGQAAPIGRKLFENLHITVVKNAEALAAIKTAAVEATGNPDANPLYDAPVLFLVSAKEADQPVNIASAAAIVENMHLQATEQFLGSCFLMGIMYNGTLDAPGLKGETGGSGRIQPRSGSGSRLSSRLFDRKRTDAG